MFTNSTGNENQPYGRAMDTYSAVKTCPKKGNFSVDFTGTGLQMMDSVRGSSEKSHVSWSGMIWVFSHKPHQPILN